MKLNIKNKILVIVLPIIVVSLVLTGYFAYITASNTIIQQETTSMSREVSNLVRQLETWFEIRLSIAETLSRDVKLIQACVEQNPQVAQERLKNIAQQLGGYENVFLTDMNGVIFVGSTEGSVGVPVRDIPEYKINIDEALNGQSHVGDAFASPVTGRPVSLITVPVKKDGQIVGILGTPIELQDFSKRFIKTITFGETGYAYIVDSNGMTLAHQNEDYILEVDVTQHDFGRTILEQKNGTLEYVWNGENKLAAFQEYPAKGWIIATVMDQSELLAPIKTIRSIVLIVGFLSVVMAFLLIYSLTQKIVRPIHQSVQFAQRISSGDFSENLEIKSRDEVGDLTKALNNMVNDLRAMIQNIQKASEQVAASSEQLSASSQNLANASTEQAANLEETSASIEELVISIEQNTDNAQKTNNVTTQASNQAEEGGKAVVDTVEAMKKIAEQITIIDDIADQTNLLALNAAIEAARAGEMGKGFAVVAVEVRKLAERSSEAAKEISTLAKGSVERAENAGNLIQEVVPAIQKASQLVQEIAAACSEQSNGADQIRQSVSQLDEVTQQNSSTSEETASTSEELAAQAQSLQELVSQFDLGNEFKRNASDSEQGIQARIRERKPLPESPSSRSFSSGKHANPSQNELENKDEFQRF